MKKVVITDHAFSDVDFERSVTREHNADLSVHQCTSPAETTEAVTGADIVVTNFAKMDRPQISAMNPGGTIVRYGVGVDNVDTTLAKALGIQVANVPDYGIETVADHTSSMLLALLRHLPQYSAVIRQEGWTSPPQQGLIPDFANTTIGFLGAGRISRAVARRLRVFGFTFIAYDPYVSPEVARSDGISLRDFSSVLSESDAISLHMPSTTETTRLLGDDAFSQMKDGVVIVNTSRGSILDEDALARAIQRKKVGGAGLDVFDPEPLEPHSMLRSFDNVLLTPHAAFYSVQSLAKLQRLAGEEIGRALRGEALRSPVNY